MFLMISDLLLNLPEIHNNNTHTLNKGIFYLVIYSSFKSLNKELATIY